MYKEWNGSLLKPAYSSRVNPNVTFCSSILEPGACPILLKCSELHIAESALKYIHCLHPCASNLTCLPNASHKAGGNSMHHCNLSSWAQKVGFNLTKSLSIISKSAGRPRTCRWKSACGGMRACCLRSRCARRCTRRAPQEGPADWLMPSLCRRVHL